LWSATALIDDEQAMNAPASKSSEFLRYSVNLAGSVALALRFTKASPGMGYLQHNDKISGDDAISGTAANRISARFDGNQGWVFKSCGSVPIRAPLEP
jgi:hypothetical protein